ncbi:hypothetical protein CLOM_g11394 [Closterium sp. NIES-68]|nr:hypothetical protein CLOM_g11394 [Closterium sp. NIES-68]GJP71692.1 hypothetical protein CLOP_g2500 [Closterium sp. NIES-67]
MALPRLTPFKLQPPLLLPTSILLFLILLSSLPSPSPMLTVHAMTPAAEPESQARHAAEPEATTPASEPQLLAWLSVGAAAQLHQGWRWLGVGPLMSSLGTRLGKGLGNKAGEDGEEEDKAKEFLAGKPQVEVESSGGRIEAWGAGLKRLEDADISAAVMTIEPESMSLPMYSNDEEVSYVVEGEARAGLISPEGIRTNVRRLRKGDAFAFPRGWGRWIWNDGKEPLRIISIADTSKEAHRGRYTAFSLVGAQKGKFGGILHGFSHRVLARAWGVEEGDVQTLLQGQKDAAIVKVDPGKVASGDLDAMDAPAAASAAAAAAAAHTDAAAAAAGAAADSEGTVAFGDFVYNLIDEQPSIDTARGGTLTSANGFKLPVFRHLGVAAARIDLMPNAVAAPHWLSNSATVHFMTRGSGRFEITYPDGRKALRRRVNAGDVIVVPADFPHAVVASGEGLEYVALSPKSKPKPGFLAGSNSVYSALPTAVLRAAFNVDGALVAKLQGSREDEYVILSPTKGG